MFLTLNLTRSNTQRTLIIILHARLSLYLLDYRYYAWIQARSVGCDEPFLSIPFKSWESINAMFLTLNFALCNRQSILIIILHARVSLYLLDQ